MTANELAKIRIQAAITKTIPGAIVENVEINSRGLQISAPGVLVIQIDQFISTINWATIGAAPKQADVVAELQTKTPADLTKLQVSLIAATLIDRPDIADTVIASAGIPLNSVPIKVDAAIISSSEISVTDTEKLVP